LISKLLGIVKELIVAVTAYCLAEYSYSHTNFLLYLIRELSMRMYFTRTFKLKTGSPALIMCEIFR
jgi:hypothetical protein